MTGLRSRLLDPRRADVVLALSLITAVLVIDGLAGSMARYWTAPIVVLGGAAALVLRSRRLGAGVLLFSATGVAPVVFGQSSVLAGPVNALLCVPFLLSYTLGTTARRLRGLAGVAVLSAALQAGTYGFNPFLLVITVGPWIAGRIIQSRQQLNEQLAGRNREMEAERERYAQESVRYERARIAQELHDLVGHSVTVMVVQAGAGQRLAHTDPDLVSEVFDGITDAVDDAHTEIGRLVDLLAVDPTEGDRVDLNLVNELVRRAGRAGLQVSCQWIGDCNRMQAATANVAIRVVKESLTNAMKHAPGAPVQITMRATDDQLEVEVVNAATRLPLSGLERSGGGRGLTGMRERVGASGGTLHTTRTVTSGWKVTALLPIDRRPTQHDQHLEPG